MSKFTLLGGGYDLALNSGATTGLRIYRIDVSWFAGDEGTPTPNGWLFITRYNGLASGGTSVACASVDDGPVAASSGQISPTTYPAGGATIGRWALCSAGWRDPSSLHWIDWGGEKTIDLSDSPIEAASGNCLQLGGMPGGEMVVFFEEHT